MNNLMLEGLRVLDFSRLLPGPFATLLLADMGADVLKVEDTFGGDYARYYPPLVGESGAFFEALNRNKRSLTLNLKHPEGSSVIHKLVEQTDVIVESFRPGVMEALGVGYEALREINPGLIYCSISGYGQSGTMKNRAGHDMNYLAHAGLLGQSAAKGELALPGFQLADIAGGALYAATGVLAALYRRTTTNTGTHLDISMTEGALSFAIPMLAMHRAGGNTSPGQGMLNGGIAAYNIYRTKDNQHLAVAALEPKFWLGFVQAIGRPELADQGHSEGDVSQIQTIAEILLTRDLSAWSEIFSALDVCVEPVLSLDETLMNELHRSRDVFFELNGVQHTRTPLTPLREHRAAPRLGEHTDDILTELGFDVASLRGKGVV